MTADADAQEAIEAAAEESLQVVIMFRGASMKRRKKAHAATVSEKDTGMETKSAPT